MICACGCGSETRGGVYKRGHQARRPERRADLVARNKNRKGWKNVVLSLRNKGQVGDRNPAWKGNDVGYVALHLWVSRNKLKEGRCSECNTKGYTEWANVSGEYHRDLDDFIELCKDCHVRFDRKRGR